MAGGALAVLVEIAHDSEASKHGRVRSCVIVREALEPVRAWLDERRAVWDYGEGFGAGRGGLAGALIAPVPRDPTGDGHEDDRTVIMSLDENPPGEAVLVGLIGAGIGASRTPGLHEREGARLGLRYVYKLIDLDVLGLDAGALPDLLLAAQRLGFSGLNITHPCKQAVIPLLDALSPDAEAIGAVNTVVLREGRRVGHNTDWSGFAESFRRDLPDAARDRVVLLGAGGGGAAVAHALLTEGVRLVSIVDMDAVKAQRLASSLGVRFGAGRAEAASRIEAALEGADGLVNTTPMGMASYPGAACPPALLHPALWVADIVYFPLETELLAQARARGCRVMAGGGMAVFQAVGAFALFSGRTPDSARMIRDFAKWRG